MTCAKKVFSNQAIKTDDGAGYIIVIVRINSRSSLCGSHFSALLSNSFLDN